MTRAELFLVLLAPVVATFAACGADEDVNPLSGSAASAGGASSSSSSSMDAGSDAQPFGGGGPKKRDVFQRDPFGDVAATNNLLWDGDFEWTSPFSDESGWYYGSSELDLQPVPPTTIGAACKSGIKCAKMAKGTLLIGLAVASETKPITASVWYSPQKKDCEKTAKVYVANIGVGSDPMVVLAPESKTPDESGWCHATGTTGVRTEKPLIYVSNESGDDLIVDDVDVEIASSDKKETHILAHVFEAGERERLVAMGLRVRDLRRRDPRPTAALRAFTEWKRR